MLIKLRNGELIFVGDCCQVLLGGLLDTATDQGTPENDVALVIAGRGLLSSNADGVQKSMDALQAVIAAGLRAVVAEGNTP